ncbi:MAG: hypothetical protein ABFD64_10745 [Armatimonadota bacterium]
MSKLLLFLLLFVPCSAFAAAKSADLSDLKDFGTIEKLMLFGEHEKPRPEQLYLRSLRDELTKTPASERADLLRKLADETKWGTYQRFMAYSVCVWYGIDYTKTRDYITHATFWWEWKIGTDADEPFNLSDVGIDFLYALYERNHDFKILHDIITTKSDAAVSELIIGFTLDAVEKHPRGVLHVAAISEKGRDLAWKLLHLSPRDEDHPLYILYYTEDALNGFRAYVTKVANDPKDSLSSLAKRLVAKSNKNAKGR